MTYQPPPPPPPGPPGGTPPPPPPGPPGPPPGPGGPSQWGPPPGPGGPGGFGGPPGGSGKFDPKSVNQLDWGIMGAGLLAFIFSFISYYSYSGKGDFASDISIDQNAWNGFFGWFAMLLALVGSVVVALELFQPNVKLPFPNRLIGLGAYAVATLSVLLALLVVPDYGGGGAGYDSAVDEGHGFGYWVSLIVIVAGAVLSFMRFTQTGGQLPIGGNKPGGGPGLPPPPPR